jgi:hypothetical protein
VSVEALPGAGFDGGPQIRAVPAKADAFVSGANKVKNFGRAPDLRIDASSTFRTFLRFNVNVKSPDVTWVNLMLYSRTRSQAGYQVRLVEETWRERKITFLNAPSLSSEFVLSGPVKARSWTAVDVTSLLDVERGGGNSVSLALTTRSRRALELASRETGLHGPRLVVERDGNVGGVPSVPTPPTPTPQGPPSTGIGNQPE